MTDKDADRIQAEQITLTLKRVAGRYGETVDGKLSCEGAQIDRDQLASLMDITRDQANVLKRALMARGLVTQTRQHKGPAMLRFHYPPLTKDERQSVARRTTDVAPDNVEPITPPPTPRHNVAIWCLVREPGQLAVDGVYSAEQLRALAESVESVGAKILVKGGTYTAQQLTGLCNQVDHMLRNSGSSRVRGEGGEHE